MKPCGATARPSAARSSRFLAANPNLGKRNFASAEPCRCYGRPVLVRLYDNWLYRRRHGKLVGPVARYPQTRDALAEIKAFLSRDCHTACAGTSYNAPLEKLEALIAHGITVAPAEEKFHFLDMRRYLANEDETPYISRYPSHKDGQPMISFSVASFDAFVNRGLGVYPRHPFEPMVDDWGETDISKYDELSFLEHWVFGDKARGRQRRVGKRNMDALLKAFLAGCAEDDQQPSATDAPV